MWAAADELRANSRLKSSEYPAPSDTLIHMLRRVYYGILKETTIETIKRLPDGRSPEDIMYRINLVAQVLEGIRDAEAGRLINTEELLEKVDQWAK